MNLYYLKSTIMVEPLIWRWYAWPYLIPPITAGCNIAERHLNIMLSYVNNPKVHAQAVKDPKLLGGPFLDLEEEKISEIKELITQTKKDCEQLILLNQDLKEIDKIIQTEAQGDSLENIYKRIPDSLKGLIELVYDLNNHPSIRLIEPLIYKSYYSEESQSIALSEMTSDFRKFLLSTPRVNQENELYLKIPFSSSQIETIASLKETPRDLHYIKKNLSIPGSKMDLFMSFLTEIAPTLPEDRNYKGDGIRLRYFGHACVLLETKDISILFDPVISYLRHDNEVPRYTFQDLPDVINYVVITHNHQDHLMFETLLQLRHKTKQFVFPSNRIGALEDPSIKLIFEHTGFSSLLELKEMESIKLAGGEIIALPFLGEHSDLNIQSKLSYCVKLKGKSFLFAVDSNNLEPLLYRHVFSHVGTIDMLFLGMECDGAPLSWLYGPLLTRPLKRSYDFNRTLSGSNYEKAWKIAKESKCKEAYVYAMGQEPWLNYIMALKYEKDSPQIIESDKFIKTCIENGVHSERLFGKNEWIFD